MLNMKMCNGSHAVFEKFMLGGEFCRSQPTLKRFHLETDSSVELCAAAAAQPPPTECRRRAGAVFVTCSCHVVAYTSYMLLDFCNAVYSEA